MTSAGRILSISITEAKLLYRTWKFWILTILAVLLLLVVNLYYSLLNFRLSGESGSVGVMSLPFVLAVYYGFYGMLFSFIVIWFSYQFRHKDRKSRVEEVLLSRPASTAELVLGKFFGVLIPVLCLSLFLYVLSVLVSAFFLYVIRIPWPNLALYFTPHLVHLLPQNVVGILFICALTFFLVTATKSRVVAIVAANAVIILVVLVLQVFAKWVSPFYFPLLDFQGMSQLYFYSDLIGYDDFTPFALQRTYIFFLTAILLCLTILLYPRLRDAGRRPARVLGVLAVSCAVVLGLGTHFLLSANRQQESRRAAMEEQKALAGHARLRVSHYDMSVRFPETQQMQAAVRLRAENPAAAPLQELVFVLNSGLTVDSVKDAAGKPLSFEKKHTVLKIQADPAIAPGGGADLEVAYHGTLSADALFLNSDHEFLYMKGRSRGSMALANGILPFWLGKNHKFLVGEARWYPSPNVDTGYVYPDRRPENFATSRISVEVPEGHAVISQGELAEERPAGSGKTAFVWESNIPCPKFSINAGKFRIITGDFDGLHAALYYDPVHEKNIDFFRDIGPELKKKIHERLESYKTNTGLDYPYPVLSVVEVPGQARTYSEGWDSPNILFQPGVIMLRETGLFTANFQYTFSRKEKQAKRQEKDTTPTEMKMAMLQQFFDYDLTGGNLEEGVMSDLWAFRTSAAGSLYPLIGPSLASYVGECATGKRLFHSIYLTDDVNKTIGKAFQLLFTQKASNIREGIIEGSLDQQEIRKTLADKPLARFVPADDPKLYFEIMQVKGRPFLATLRALMTDGNFVKLLGTLLERFRFSSFTMEDLRKAAEEIQGSSLQPLFDNWLNATQVPGFILREATAYRIKREDPRPLFQIVVRVENGEPADGFCRLEFQTEGDTIPRVVHIPGNRVVETALTVPQKPKRVVMEPIYAKNIWPIREELVVPEEEKAAEPLDATRTLEPDPLEKRTILVDDADPGFDTEGPAARSFFRPRKEKGAEKEYPAYPGFSVPGQWSQWDTDDAYGRYNRGLKVKGAGKGTQAALWKAKIPEAGDYELFSYIGLQRQEASGDRRERRRPRPELGTNYKYVITAGGTTETAKLDARNAEKGWNSLGKYHLEKDSTVEVKLTDDADGLVIADAIRLVPAFPPAAPAEEAR